MPPRDPSLPEGTDHIIDTNIDLGDSGGAGGVGGGGGSAGGAPGGGGETAGGTSSSGGSPAASGGGRGDDQASGGSAFKFDQAKGDDGGNDGGKSEGIAAGIAGQIKDQISGFKSQAEDRVRTLADDGKAQATSFLQSIAEVLSDAASSIEEKLGDQYAGPGHSASDSIRSLAGRLDDSSVDDLYEGARSFMKKSPALAIGAAALVGFAVARVLRSSIAEFRSGGQDDAGPASGGGQGSGGAGSGAAA